MDYKDSNLSLESRQEVGQRQSLAVPAQYFPLFVWLRERDKVELEPDRPDTVKLIFRKP